MSLRLDVFDLDGGRCVGCGKRLARGGGPWQWHAHHCIRQNTLKARGVRPKWWRGPVLAVLLCWDCHGDQTSKMRTVPLERLPERIHKAAILLGPWAVDTLAREHPPMPPPDLLPEQIPGQMNLIDTLRGQVDSDRTGT